jgi:uncharacterized membrane protein
MIVLPSHLDVMITEPLAQLLLLVVIVFVSLVLAKRFTLFRSLGAGLVGILLGMAASNSGILPGESPVYEFLSGTGVSIGVVLILLCVDVRSVLQAGPRMLVAFGLGALGSAIGAMIAGLVFFRQVGDETWKLAGQFGGTYIGGGVNFAALGQAFGTSSNLFTAALAADVSLAAIWMAICLTVPVLLGRKKQVGDVAEGTDSDTTGKPMTLERALYNSGRAITLRDAAALVAIAVGALWFSELLAVWLPVIPRVLWLTTLALIAAQVRGVRALPGAAMAGNYLVLLFLASNGARSVVANIVQVGPFIFYFAALALVIHGLVLFGLGRLLKLDPATLAVASQANIGGAAHAMALASARGYADRVLPGVAVSLLGYAAGNYIGFAVGAVVRGLVGG